MVAATSAEKENGAENVGRRTDTFDEESKDE